jgi:hypothetical protein
MKVELQKSVRKEINIRIAKRRDDDLRNFRLKRERNIETLLDKNRIRLELKKRDQYEKN